jgi:plasmid maintenance system antidote protein VapI
MHNPPHPGEFIRDVYLDALQLSVRDVAWRLQVTPAMALRLSRCLGRSAESWLAMQAAHDLWQARQHLDLTSLQPLVEVSG